MSGTWLRTQCPCHSRTMRFRATHDVPRETYDRRCKHCGIHWTVTRTTIRDTRYVRADKLEWAAESQRVMRG